MATQEMSFTKGALDKAAHAGGAETRYRDARQPQMRPTLRRALQFHYFLSGLPPWLDWCFQIAWSRLRGVHWCPRWQRSRAANRTRIAA